MTDRFNILILDPFLGESHNSFWKAFQKNSVHNIEISTFPSKHWKLSSGLSSHVEVEKNKYDLFIASDFFDIATFKGLNPKLAHIPFICYFHENQLEYPVMAKDKRDDVFSLINYRNFLSSDANAFNSLWNYNSFKSGVSRLRKSMPSAFRRLIDINLISGKPPHIIYPGHFFNELPITISKKGPLRIVWNHRWEHDKGTDTLLDLCKHIRDKNLNCLLDLCGEKSKNSNLGHKIKDILKDKLVNEAPYEDKFDYYKALSKAHIVLSTAKHEFFGISVLEGILHGACPILPNKLSYPELYSEYFENISFYETTDELKSTVERLTTGQAAVPKIKTNEIFKKFQFQKSKEKLDKLVIDTIKQ